MRSTPVSVPETFSDIALSQHTSRGELLVRRLRSNEGLTSMHHRGSHFERRGRRGGEEELKRGGDFLGNATVRGRAWYKVLEAPVLTLDVTV